MYKKSIAYIIGFIFIIFIIYKIIIQLDLGIAPGGAKDVSYKVAVKTGHEGERIPSIELLLLDSLSKVNISARSELAGLVVFYFSPFCPFCREEMKEIIACVKQEKNAHFYLITPYSISDTKHFYDLFKLKEYQNVTLGIDYKYQFGNYFKIRNVPFMAIYNRKSRMEGAYIGGVTFDQIHDMLNN